MKIDWVDVWLTNLGFGGYVGVAYVVKQVGDHFSDIAGMAISIATVLGGLALAWYNVEKALTVRMDRKKQEREKAKGDKPNC
jgi:hypothetical protein